MQRNAVVYRVLANRATRVVKDPRTHQNFRDTPMRKLELGSLKNQTKRLSTVQFRTLRRGGLPRPLDKIGGKR